MIVCAAILSKSGAVFFADFLPQKVKLDISKHANSFLYTLGIEDDDIDLPYVETTYVRYVYKQTDDLYWLLVTKPESNLTKDVNLLGKFVCTIMEYGSPVTDSSSLTDEQRNLYYRHIWRAWDDNAQCSFCGRYNHPAEIWEQEFDARLQFLIRIRDGDVDDKDVEYFNGLISESWLVHTKLTQKSNAREENNYDFDSDSVCSEESISEETVIDGVRLACRFEDIHLAVKRLQDPYLRLFVRRDLLIDSTSSMQTQISSAPSFEELDSTCE